MTRLRKKENPRPLRPHPLPADSSATLHLINFYRGGHPKLDGCHRPAEVALETARVLPLPLAAAYLHRLASTFWTLVDWGFLRDWARDFSHGEGT